MGNYDDYGDYNNSPSNNSGGIIGTIISLLILAAIWPYLLAAIGLYVVYIAAVAIFDWMTQNPFAVVCILLVLTAIYAVFRYQLILKAWRVLVIRLKAKPTEIDLMQKGAEARVSKLEQRKFIPSSNLYCYWCTKKLGIKAWEKKGKYYCDECGGKLN